MVPPPIPSVPPREADPAVQAEDVPAVEVIAAPPVPPPDLELRIAAVVAVIGAVETMGGDPVRDLLAPSEMRAIAQALVETGLVPLGDAAPVYPPHLAWMSAVPEFMQDCFSS